MSISSPCIGTNQILVMLTMLWWPCSHMRCAPAPSLTSWRPGAQDTGGETQGQPCLGSGQCKYLTGEAFWWWTSERLVYTGHRRNANSRMIQWYNAPVSSHNLPFLENRSQSQVLARSQPAWAQVSWAARTLRSKQKEDSASHLIHKVMAINISLCFCFIKRGKDTKCKDL